ncbi:MAG: signal transduction histidine kinase [Bacteroidetes bacterium OLB11]|nr:MAG: signal transduction histidine kinase [Bacteroidetes bacterium OLB11]
MNPHFMYNTLNSIQALILKQDIKNSNLYLSKFSHLMRKVLDVSGRDEISIQEEIEILELYLSLEKLRFGNDFLYKIIISNEVETQAIFLPPLLLQPFVENAIKHGLLHKKGEKQLIIRLEKETNHILCRIKDNGIGRKHSAEIKKTSTRKIHIVFN